MRVYMRQETINTKGQVRLVVLREPHEGVISHKGTMLQSATGEELRRRRTLMPSVLRPSGGAFKGEL